MNTPQTCTVPRYERTSLAAPDGVELTELQGYILLLCAKPHTLKFILTAFNAITLQARPYCDVYMAITQLRKLGLLVMYPPVIAGTPVKLPSIPNYQQWRYAA